MDVLDVRRSWHLRLRALGNEKMPRSNDIKNFLKEGIKICILRLGKMTKAGGIRGPTSGARQS